MSKPNRRGAMALVSASLCLLLAALVSFSGPAPALTASAPVAVPAAADWGLSFPTEGEPPVGNATAEDLAQYGAYYLGDTSRKVLYLTFDCGYENGYTEAILDALKKHSAPAAFFVVGHMIESAPDIVRRMAEEGHIVGNHTFHHPDMSSISDLASFQEELTDLEDLYQETTGQPLSKFYRPPQGKYSAGEPEAGPAAGVHHRLLEPGLCGLEHGRPALGGGGLCQAAAPDPRRGHRPAPLHLRHQRRHSG